MRERLEAGEVTGVEYDTWLDFYTPFKRVG